MDLLLDGEEVTLLFEADLEKDYEPHVYLLSSGELEPRFTARLRPAFENEGWLLRGLPDGSVELVREDLDNAF